VDLRAIKLLIREVPHRLEQRVSKVDRIVAILVHEIQ
jgi:hypothetical protein